MRILVALLFTVLAVLPAIAHEAQHGPVPTTSADAPEPLLGRVRQLTFDGRRSGEGYFSADGRFMVFQSEREAGNPFYQIYLLDLQEGTSRRVSTGVGKTTCAWVFPDGKRVLFASTHLDPEAGKKQKDELDARAAGQKKRYAWDYDPQFDLFTMSLADGSVKRLTEAGGYDAEAAVSPDGKRIVFASNRHAYPGLGDDPSRSMDIYLMNADGSGVRRLTTADGYDGGPFFSADGKRICWRHFSTDGATSEVFTMKADGTDARQVTRMGAMSWAPYFHPSGDYLIYATNKHGFGNFELYMVDAAGQRDPVRVTFKDGFDGLPVFTPDGGRLAWTSNRTADGQSQIFVAEWDDAAARRLLELGPASLPTPIALRVPLDVPRLRAYVERLASEEMDGRLTGTDGELKAARYVASVYESVGLEPAGDRGGWLQAFPFTAGLRLGPGNRLEAGGAPAKVDVDWRPLTFSRSGEVALAPVVFAGYGLVAPAMNGQPEYDSYVHLDVKDKWVLIFRYVPEGVSAELRQHLTRFSGLRYKAMQARDRGARGLIVATGPNASAKDELVKLGMDASLSGSSLPAISVSNALAERILAPSGKTLKGLQDALDAGSPVMGFVVRDQRVGGTIDIVQEKRTGHNVVARLRAPGSSGAEAVVVGAHLDHLGRGLDGNSLARGDERGKVHYGADDNASGVAGMLEIARYLAANRASLKRDVIFAAWSGEELGILGSSHFVRELGEPMKPRVVAYVNMDMIGRLQQSLVLQGMGSSSWWTAAVERGNAPIGLPLALRNESYLPTDATAFYIKGIPILSAFTGAHAEYHSPRDVPSLIDYESLSRIGLLMARVTQELASTTAVPDYKRMEKPAQQESRAGLRAYLGTIPDYAQGDVPGLKLSGVAARGPAEAAGIRAGDVIIELAGRKIENVYDYTYAIEALKIGQPVKIVVQRAGERVELMVTPTSRD